MRRYHIRQLNISKGNRFWWGEISEGGKRKRINLKTESEAEATLWKKRQEALEFLPADMRNAQIVEMTDKKARNEATPIQLLDQYRSQLSGLHKASPRTMWAYDFRLTRVRPLVERAVLLDDVGRAAGNEWVHKMVSDKLAPKTIHEIVKVGRGFFRWAIECGHCKQNPLESVQLPRRRKTEKAFWLPAEVDAILAKAPNSSAHGFWATMAFAGLRHAEAADLTWGRVDLVRKEFRLMGKGAKAAILPIAPKLTKVLNALKPKGAQNGDLCFPAMDKYPSNRMRALLAACKGLTFEVAGELNMHRFRHSFASNLLRAGVGIKAVQALMRHEDPRITLDTYGHLLTEDLASALKSL